MPWSVRPSFLPPLPVMGVVRKRELETHQSRLDMDAYERHVTRLAYKQERPFVIVGAGFAGARAAQILTNYGYDVLVLDKGTIPEGDHQRSGVNLERTIMVVMPSVEKSTPTCPSTKCSRDRCSLRYSNYLHSTKCRVCSS